MRPAIPRAKILMVFCAPMFSANYIQDSWKRRNVWLGKKAIVGDWYLELTDTGVELRIVDETTADTDVFFRKTTAFVPDTDDLLELVDNQIRAWHENPAQKTMKIVRNSDGNWCMEVEYGKKVTYIGKADSLQALLMHTIIQMSCIMPKANSYGSGTTVNEA